MVSFSEVFFQGFFFFARGFVCLLQFFFVLMVLNLFLMMVLFFFSRVRFFFVYRELFFKVFLFSKKEKWVCFFFFRGVRFCLASTEFC